MTSRDSRLLDSLKNFLRDKSITESERISSIEKYIVIAEKNFGETVGVKHRTSEKAIFWKNKAKERTDDAIWWKDRCEYWKEKYQYIDAVRHDIYNKISKAEEITNKWKNLYQEEQRKSKKYLDKSVNLKTWIIVFGLSTLIMATTIAMTRSKPNHSYSTKYDDGFYNKGTKY